MIFLHFDNHKNAPEILSRLFIKDYKYFLCLVIIKNYNYF